jgi:hypothetical protein
VRQVSENNVAKQARQSVAKLHDVPGSNGDRVIKKV